MKKLSFLFLASLLLPLAVVAQSTPACSWRGSLTAAATSSVANPNNTANPNCNAFALTWNSTGFTAVSIQIEGGDVVGGPFVAFSGTSVVIVGTNPATSLSGATVIQASSKLAFIRVTLNSASGSGAVNWQIFGYNGVTAAAKSGGGGGGGGCTPAGANGQVLYVDTGGCNSNSGFTFNPLTGTALLDNVTINGVTGAVTGAGGQAGFNNHLAFSSALGFYWNGGPGFGKVANNIVEVAVTPGTPQVMHALLAGSASEGKPLCSAFNGNEGYMWYTPGSSITNGLSYICTQSQGTYNWITNTQSIALAFTTLATSPIASGTCAAVLPVSAPGVVSGDNILADFLVDPTSTAGFLPGAMLTIIKYPSTDTINIKACNNTALSITPGSGLNLILRVVR